LFAIKYKKAEKIQIAGRRN
jgi:hypothetical protein